MKSLTEIQENSKGKRLPEGWNDVTPTSIKFIETKNKGGAIIIEMRDDEGCEAVDFLYEDTEDMDPGQAKAINARLAQLAEAAGITKEEWYDGISGDAVVELLNSKLFRFSVNTVWGKGDGCFVRQYAAASSQQQTPPPVARPAQPAANGAARPARKF